MSTKSLWGNLSDLQVVRTPKSILKEQADILTAQTKGVLVGGLRTIPNLAELQEIAFALVVVVPSLDSYSYKLLTVRHGVDLYPCDVVFGDQLAVCQNEQEFETLVASLLSSDRVKTILARLLSQAVA